MSVVSRNRVSLSYGGDWTVDWEGQGGNREACVEGEKGMGGEMERRVRRRRTMTMRKERSYCCTWCRRDPLRGL